MMASSRKRIILLYCASSNLHFSPEINANIILDTTSLPQNKVSQPIENNFPTFVFADPKDPR